MFKIKINALPSYETTSSTILISLQGRVRENIVTSID